MDFKGQKLAEAVGMTLIVVFAVVGFLYGYTAQDFRAMMGVFGSGVAAALLVAVPDWPVYNKHPVKFLPPREQAQRGGGGGGRRPAKKQSASWSNLWGMF